MYLGDEVPDERNELRASIESKHHWCLLQRPLGNPDDKEE